MNKLQHFYAGSLAVLFLLTGCTRDIQAAEITPQDNGSISLYFDHGGLQCSFPFGGRAEFAEEPRPGSNYCKHLKDGGYFKLTNVPSAANFWLVNARPDRDALPYNPVNCTKRTDESYNFNWWKLTTIKQPTTMIDKVRIEDLKTKKIGDVVVPGVRLTDMYKGGTNSAYPDNINCVMMEVSP